MFSIDIVCRWEKRGACWRADVDMMKVSHMQTKTDVTKPGLTFSFSSGFLHSF